jgi:hypothetical protein
MRESSPYRIELLQFAKDLRGRRHRQLWRDDRLAKAERMLFIGFLYVRKLIECKKVSDACARSSAKVLRAAINRKREVSDFMRDDLFDDLNEVEWTETKVNIHQLADKIIHAWWIHPVQGEEGGLDGFILTTDRQRNSELWLVPIGSIVDAFTRFSKEVVKEVRASRSDSGKLTYWQAK